MPISNIFLKLGFPILSTDLSSRGLAKVPVCKIIKLTKFWHGVLEEAKNEGEEREVVEPGALIRSLRHEKLQKTFRTFIAGTRRKHLNQPHQYKYAMLLRRTTSTLAPKAFNAAAARFAPAASTTVGNRTFLNFLFQSKSEEQTGADISTPAKCIEALEAGNKRFVAGDILAPHRNMARLKEVEGGQKPFAAFLSCADSRVPVEMVFDQGFGDVFICRIAGNVVTHEIIGSLEFGCAVLGAKVLYVLGHSKCGAVSATIAGGPVPGVISSLYYQIKPACEHAHGDLDTAIAENVKVQVKQLGVSPVLKELVEDGKLEIIGGVYDLKSGAVSRVC